MPFLMSRKTAQDSHGQHAPIKIWAFLQAAKYTLSEFALLIIAARRQTVFDDAGIICSFDMLQNRKMRRRADV